MTKEEYEKELNNLKLEKREMESSIYKKHLAINPDDAIAIIESCKEYASVSRKYCLKEIELKALFQSTCK